MVNPVKSPQSTHHMVYLYFKGALRLITFYTFCGKLKITNRGMFFTKLLCLHWVYVYWTPGYPIIRRGWPLFEVRIQDSAGEALPADADALQHAVTPQLVQDQLVLHGPYKYMFMSLQSFIKGRYGSHDLFFVSGTSYQGSSFHWGWCSAQSEDGYSWGWSSVCSDFPVKSGNPVIWVLDMLMKAWQCR